MNVAGVELVNPVQVSGGDICTAWKARAADGTVVFVKTLDHAPAGFFTAEVRGLDLLRTRGGPPVPGIVGADDSGLVLDWVEPGRPDATAAAAFGRRLATTHGASLTSFGAAQPGFIGSLPLDNTPADDWSTFFAERRLAPYLGGVDRDVRVAVEAVIERIEDLAGPAEPPARIHGDLWSGNVLWGADGQAWLVDAASAHGGHRETDLAMLALFGAPHLDEIVRSYGEVAPLADGWRERVPLHQLHPLLVHVVLFGGSYSARTVTAARAALRAS